MPSDLVATGAGPVVAGWVMEVLVFHAVAAELLAPGIVAHTGPTVLTRAGLALMALSWGWPPLPLYTSCSCSPRSAVSALWNASYELGLGLGLGPLLLGMALVHGSSSAALMLVVRALRVPPVGPTPPVSTPSRAEAAVPRSPTSSAPRRSHAHG